MLDGPAVRQYTYDWGLGGGGLVSFGSARPRLAQRSCRLAEPRLQRLGGLRITVFNMGARSHSELSTCKGPDRSPPQLCTKASMACANTGICSPPQPPSRLPLPAAQRRMTKSCRGLCRSSGILRGQCSAESLARREIGHVSDSTILQILAPRQCPSSSRGHLRSSGCGIHLDEVAFDFEGKDSQPRPDGYLYPQSKESCPSVKMIH